MQRYICSEADEEELCFQVSIHMVSSRGKTEEHEKGGAKAFVPDHLMIARLHCCLCSLYNATSVFIVNRKLTDKAVFPSHSICHLRKQTARKMFEQKLITFVLRRKTVNDS